MEAEKVLKEEESGDEEVKDTTAQSDPVRRKMRLDFLKEKKKKKKKKNKNKKPAEESQEAKPEEGAST